MKSTFDCAQMRLNLYISSRFFEVDRNPRLSACQSDPFMRLVALIQNRRPDVVENRFSTACDLVPFQIAVRRIKFQPFNRVQ